MSNEDEPVGALAVGDEEAAMEALADEVARRSGLPRTDGQDGYTFVTRTVSRLVDVEAAAKASRAHVVAERDAARREAADARAERDTALAQIAHRSGYREVNAQVTAIIESMSNALAHTGRAIEAAADALAAMNGGEHD